MVLFCPFFTRATLCQWTNACLFVLPSKVGVPWKLRKGSSWFLAHMPLATNLTSNACMIGKFGYLHKLWYFAIENFAPSCGLRPGKKLSRHIDQHTSMLFVASVHLWERNSASHGSVCSSSELFSRGRMNSALVACVKTTAGWISSFRFTIFHVQLACAFTLATRRPTGNLWPYTGRADKIRVKTNRHVPPRRAYRLDADDISGRSSWVM